MQYLLILGTLRANRVMLLCKTLTQYLLHCIKLSAVTISMTTAVSAAVATTTNTAWTKVSSA